MSKEKIDVQSLISESEESFKGEILNGADSQYCALFHLHLAYFHCAMISHRAELGELTLSPEFEMLLSSHTDKASVLYQFFCMKVSETSSALVNIEKTNGELEQVIKELLVEKGVQVQ